MNDFELALFLHLFGVLLFASGIVVAGVAFEAGRRREAPAEIALLLSLSRVGVLLVVAGGVILFGAGLWLVDITAFEIGEGWLSASMALFIASLIVGGAGGQRPKRARHLAGSLAEQGRPATPELRELLDNPVALALNYLSGLMVLAVLVLMVFKP
ncbi:MAG: DUF2269 family protein [Solirubrobacterales bacterium]